MDNGLVRVSVASDGAVRVHDLARDRIVEDAFRLEDAGDVGDLYTPAIRATRPVASARRVTVVHRGPLRGEIAVELRAAWRAASRVGGTVHAVHHSRRERSLRARRVDGWNGAPDHRLRLRVATGVAPGETIADAAFRPVVRTPLALSAAEQLIEHVVPTAPLHRWVARFDAAEGATVFSDGLAEYESLADGAVAVTLVRAVGALSRVDLPERPGHAGWPADTPTGAVHRSIRGRVRARAARPGVACAARRDRADRGRRPPPARRRNAAIEPRRAAERGGLELMGEGSRSAPRARRASTDGWCSAASIDAMSPSRARGVRCVRWRKLHSRGWTRR